jgi:multidrug resistance efflux pump
MLTPSDAYALQRELDGCQRTLAEARGEVAAAVSAKEAAASKGAEARGKLEDELRDVKAVLSQASPPALREP